MKHRAPRKSTAEDLADAVDDLLLVVVGPFRRIIDAIAKWEIPGTRPRR